AHISDRIAVMYLGKLVELAESLELCSRPAHPYTQALFTAALPAHPDQPQERVKLTGEVPSALNVPSGCRFHPRCPHATARCAEGDRPRPQRRLPPVLGRGHSGDGPTISQPWRSRKSASSRSPIAEKLRPIRSCSSISRPAAPGV